MARFQRDWASPRAGRRPRGIMRATRSLRRERFLGLVDRGWCAGAMSMARTTGRREWLSIVAREPPGLR